MKIIFNLLKVGLGNNGGTRTLIKCAETLAQLNNEVFLVTKQNKYTWHKIKNVKLIKQIPKGDVIIATGFNSVKSTINSNIKKKYYYIRGFEIWKTDKKKLINSYRKLNCIVNSEWLQKMLKKNGVKSHLIYPGLDYDKFYIENNNRNIDIGALFSKRHETKKHKHAIEIANKLNCNLKMLNKHITNASEDESRKFYNSIKVWFAPTILEGLHNPPMEASLCGCALVCTNHKRNGMNDYAIHNKTALVYKEGDLNKAKEYIKTLINNNSLRNELNNNMINLLKEKINTRPNNMKKMIDIFKK